MPELTIAGLSARISTFIDNKNTFLDQLRDWHGGSATGGPNGDGIYPLTNGSGLVIWEPCPAKLADSVSGPATLSQAAAAAAELAASLAASHSATAEEQAIIAEASKTAVLSSVADSQAAAIAAQGFAANAASSLANTVVLTNGFANAVTTLNTNTGNLANAVSAQTALSTLVTDARAEVSAKAATVATQANAVALANSTVTADKAIVLTAKTDTLGYRDAASGHASHAAASLANTITARDTTLGYRNTAQTAATNAATSAMNAADDMGMAGSYASISESSSIAADAARVLAEAARDEAQTIVGGPYQIESAILTNIIGRGAIGTANTTSIPDRATGDTRWLLNSLKATQAEAEAGSVSTKWMTPLQTKQAITALAPPPSYGSSASDLGTASSAGSASSVSRSDHAHIFPLATVSQTLTATGSLSSSDHGRIVEWNAASAALTLPNNLAVGFNCLVRVIHASGIPTFTAASGGTIRQADGLTKGRKQWSEISVSVRANSGGAAAEYVLSGDLSL